MNGDELLDLDYGALLERHRDGRRRATVVVAQVNSPFGVVELDDEDRDPGFREAPKLEHWVNAGRLRARRGGARAAAGEGRPRA